MFDLHCHVLPGVDDGCTTIEESIIMIKKSIDMGVTDIVCTPHYRAPYLADKKTLNKIFNFLKKHVEDNGLNIRLYLGQEIKVNDESIKELLSDELLKLNNTQYALCEFDFYEYDDISEICYSLNKKGVKPVVAHVERYSYVNDVFVVEEIKNSDGLIQVNAESILGKNGSWVKKFVYKLIKEGLVDFISSDYHNVRENYMGKAYKKIEKKFGQDIAEKLFTLNAKNLITKGSI